MKNDKIYTLRTVRRMLDLADHFISYDKPNIFRDTGNAEALHALQAIVLSIQSPASLSSFKWKKDIEKNIANIKQKVDIYNTSTKPQPLQAHTENAENNAEANEPPPLEKVIPISVFDWANLYKQLMQHGQILDKKSLEVNATWHIFLHQLRRLQNAFVSREAYLSPELTQNFSDESELLQINKNLVIEYFLKFIGQLCCSGHSESAKVIHNYIHLATKVLEGQRVYGMKEDSTGSMVLNVLLASLDLSGMIVLPVGEQENRYLDALNAEFRFFPKLTPILIAEPIFTKPFDIKMYENYRQDSQLYSSTLDGLSKLLWQDLPRLRVPVHEVIFHSPREHQAADAQTANSEQRPYNKRDSQDKRSGVFTQMLKKLTFQEQPTVFEGSSSAKSESSHRGSPRKIEHPESPTREKTSGRISPPQSTEPQRKSIIITRTSSLQKIPESHSHPKVIMSSPLSVTGSFASIEEIESSRSKSLTPSFNSTTAPIASSSSAIDLTGSVIRSAFSPVKKS